MQVKISSQNQVWLSSNASRGEWLPSSEDGGSVAPVVSVCEFRHGPLEAQSPTQ